jgi:hypothetical protein
MDMGPVADERGRQTTYSIRRWIFFKGFLVTFGRGNCGNGAILEVFGSQINGERRYGHGSTSQ